MTQVSIAWPAHSNIYVLTPNLAFGGTISSYTWICMIINFLQRREPPILPSLQKTEGKRIPTDAPEPSQFADNIDALKGCGDANKETLAQLLFHFFRHYGYEFDYANSVVSVREGRSLSREEKGWDRRNYWDKEAQKRLCVEEPFTVNRNLGNSADEYSWSGVHNEIRRAFDLLAAGQQLDKACEQYEFPPEEKPIFQRPPPKPAPTLRRSASQSGRSNHESGSARSRKNNNRNQSAQRAGNRRASSGASFGNQRIPYPLNSPPISHASSADYLTAKSNLHDQLFQQYQYLQAQQDLLRSQLAQHSHQQQHQNAPPHGRPGDVASSPHHRNAYANGLSSPRYLENPPQAAPLLPGYLYHYPARYPPPSPLTTRPRDGTITNPTSPSLASAVPALRRQVHRASVPEGSQGSVRSQSQPGRSLPHPLALQQHAHPGYDVSGVIPAPYQNVRAPQMYGGQPGLPLPFSPLTAMHPHHGSMETAMPKEYVGYYVGQSPQLGPQQFATSNSMQMPQMTLRDPPPQRPRREASELIVVPNERRVSRSPSPLNRPSYSSTADPRSEVPKDVVQSPKSYEPPVLESSVPAPVPAPVDIGGPLIVNGSNPAVSHKLAGPVNGSPLSNELELPHVMPIPQRFLPLRTNGSAQPNVLEQAEMPERPPSSPHALPSPRSKSGPKLAMSPNGTHAVTILPEHFQELSALNGPLLSPVAEMRTPSPTQAHAFDKQWSPHANGFIRAAKTSAAKQFERGENEAPDSRDVRHERKGSAPYPSSSKPAKSPSMPAQPGHLTSNVNANHWQQATTKKGHRKAKSTASTRVSNGQPMPANETERKGG